jgi:peptidoglycan/xylan/chitin deacetylase (PgdA/CDA1 family)
MDQAQRRNRHLVCLAFDFDAMSSWIFRGATTPTALSRGEFGAIGARRILATLASRGIASTWFIPGHTNETYPDICREVHDAGHEVGHHGYLHEPPGELTRGAEEAVLARGNEAIQRLTGTPAKGYRSPAWDLSPHTVELLLAHGFVYDSSMMGHEYLPYRASSGDVAERDRAFQFGAPTRLIEMPISWSLDDYPHFEYVRHPTFTQQGLQAASGVLANWLDEYRYKARTLDWGVLTSTFHPQVIGRGHRMLLLERLIDELAGMGATFVRMDAAVAEFDGREPFAGT